MTGIVRRMLESIAWWKFLWDLYLEHSRVGLFRDCKIEIPREDLRA